MATPTLIQGNTDIGQPLQFVTAWKVNLPNPSQEGNRT